MSSRLREDDLLYGAMLGRVVWDAVLPAPPDHVHPGPGEDPPTPDPIAPDARLVAPGRRTEGRRVVAGGAVRADPPGAPGGRGPASEGSVAGRSTDRCATGRLERSVSEP